MHRCVTYLAIAYWLSRCAPMPTDDVTLAQLTRLPIQHLSANKTAVTQAFNQISPVLLEAFNERLQKYQNRADSMLRALARKEALGRAQKSSPSPKILPLTQREDRPHTQTITPKTTPEPRERQDDATVSPGKTAPASPKQGRFTD